MINLYDFKRAIEAYYEVLTLHGTKKDPAFWEPYHVCLITMAMMKSLKNIVSNDPSSEYEFYDVKQETLRYLSRMHLWHCLGVKPPIEINERDSVGRFMPLVKLTDRSKIPEISAHLRTILKDDSVDSINSAKSMLDELLDNCFAHSEINDGMFGLVCAQVWPQKNRAQIAIFDKGIGVRKSLLRSESHTEALSERNACEYATEYAISGKLGLGHSGYGLTLARGLIQNNGGAFLLASEQEYYFSKGAHYECGTLETPFQGTLIVLEWNTQVPLDSKAVYDSWPIDEDEGEDYGYDF